MSDNSTPAEAAKFQVQFAVQMLNCGRTEEANTAFENAIANLDAIIAAEEKMYYIADATKPRFMWDNEFGWVDSSCTLYTAAEKVQCDLPIDGKWMVFKGEEA